MKKIELIATDLDGTFLRNDKSISIKNRNLLFQLGDKHVIRVAATGRNLNKVKEVVSSEIPFDYIVYSSGAGVYNWKQKVHVSNKNISQDATSALLKSLMKKDINFAIFHPSPENHNYWFFRGKGKCDEFERHFLFNREYSCEIKKDEELNTQACQFLIIIREDVKHFEKLKIEIESVSTELRVIRTTSPITKGFIWVEVFHRSVSKGNGVKQICDLHEINYSNTAGIGNDYNDIDLLDFTKYSFITQNAPAELKVKYKQVPSNEEDGFLAAIQAII